jgi:parallel beta-helix repeat protein
MKRLIQFALVAGFICLLSSSAFGEIIHVPSEYTTIQAGVDAASSGDTVQVSAGTYYENIIMKSGVLIQGAGQGVTTIDGGGSGHVVYAADVDSTAALDGFAITNGRSFSGGGMFNSNSSPTVTNCAFSGNSAFSLNGGGMYNSNSSPKVINCIFSGNSANKYGGGMYNSNSSPIIINCTFSENLVTTMDLDYKGGGGGIHNENNSFPIIENCTFSGNTAYLGGGISNNNSSPTVTNSTFSKNSVFNGSGIYNTDSSSPIVTNCTFSGNNAGNLGGGIYNYISSSPMITNCTFSGNIAGNLGGGLCNNYSSSPTVTNCILWKNSPDEIFNNESSAPLVTYSDIEGGYTGTGNINADPMFVSPSIEDFHLKQGSPCIDAGNNLALSMPVTDFDGDDRKIDEPQVVDTGNGTPPIVDMGADEYHKTKAMPWILLLYDD